MLITNGTVVTWGRPNEILDDHALLIEDGRIGAIGPSAELEDRHGGVARLDAGGQYILPGNICAHGHFYSAFAVGMNVPHHPPITLPTILDRLWWPYDRALGEEEVRLAVEVGMVDAIKNGTTTYFDHHSSPNCIDGVLDLIASVVSDAGLRAAALFRGHRPRRPRTSQGGHRRERPLHRSLLRRPDQRRAHRGQLRDPRADDGLR